LKQFARLQNAEEYEKFRYSMKMHILGLIQKTAEQFRCMLLKSSETLLKKEAFPQPI
jgi:hypothetical protein